MNEIPKKCCINCEFYFADNTKEIEGFCRKFKIPMITEIAQNVFCIEYIEWFGAVE